MILAASSAFASRSSACGRFRSAKTFPELGVNSRLGIFPLLTSRPVCAQVEAAAGSGPVPVAGSRFRRLPSFGRHEERKSLPRVVLRTPRDTSRPDRLRAPARAFPQSRATSSRSHISDRSAQTGREVRRGKMPSREVTPSSGNVFADLNLPHADDLLAKAELSAKIIAEIQRRRLTQDRAAAILGIDQPKVSALKQGKLSGFSIERL